MNYRYTTQMNAIVAAERLRKNNPAEEYCVEATTTADGGPGWTVRRRDEGQRDRWDWTRVRKGSRR